MFDFLLQNALFVAGLAIFVFVIVRLIKNPHVAHLLWIVVLLKLVMPPIVSLHMPNWFAAVNQSSVETVTQARDANEIGQHSRGVPIDDTRDPLVAPPIATTNDGPNALDVAAASSLVSSAQNAMTRADWLRLAIPIWLFGSGCVIGLILLQFRRAHKILRYSELPEPSTLDLAGQIAGRLGLTSIPEIRLVPYPLSPALLVGIGRPTIMLPQTIFRGLTPSSQRTVLAHELSHYARRDHWVRWLELLVTTIYWWHPAVWLARSELRFFEELCCDMRAIQACQADQQSYAETVLSLMDVLGDSKPLIASQMTSRSQMKRRITMLAQETVAKRNRYLMTLVWIGAWVVLPIRILAQQPESPPAEPTPQSTSAREQALLEIVNQVFANVDSSNEPNDESTKRILEQALSALQENQTFNEQQRAALKRVIQDARAAASQSALIGPGTILRIEVAGALPECEIKGLYLVESDGQLSLGAPYGRVQLDGESMIEAQSVVNKHLSKILQEPDVMVRAPIQGLEGPSALKLPPAPYRIEPGELLYLQTAGAIPEQPVVGYFQVEPEGTIPLGPSYGRVVVAGMSLTQAEAAVEEKLRESCQNPEVSVIHGHWKHEFSKGSNDFTLPVKNGTAIRRNPFLQRSAGDSLDTNDLKGPDGFGKREPKSGSNAHDPFLADAHEDDPFSDAENNPFGGENVDDPFGDAGDDPFGESAKDDPFGEFGDDPFGDVGDDPFGGVE